MEDNKKEKQPASKLTGNTSKRDKIEVLTVRNWKEYLGESLLIIFSVILALVLTEWFSKLREDSQTRQVLHQLKDELIANKQGVEIQYRYHQMIMKNIDSALQHPEYAQKFLNNGEVHLEVLTDGGGVMRYDLNDVAWAIAKQHDVFSKIDLATYSLLTDIYNHQQRIIKTEEEVAKTILTWESRKPENLRITLILMRDNFFGWSVQRSPALINKYSRAIDQLKDY